MKLLLLSNSTNPGEAYLDWALEYLKHYYSENHITKVLFVPYAGVTVNWDEYEAKVNAVYNTLGVEVTSIHHFANPVEAVMQAQSIAVGGGNTFQLLKLIQENNLIEPIRNKVLNGTPYAGWSAGSNLACPTLRTTNDMPILQPPSFDCFNLIPFQINPHYLDANPVGHGGETRQQRIEEFLEANPSVCVAGLREASLLELNGHKLWLKGRKPMRIFTYKNEPQEVEPGSDVSFLLPSVS
jgi:dipeptidase E